MKRLKEKLKAIYHIVMDDEYIVFTITEKNRKMKARSAIISDNVSRITLECAIKILEQQDGREYK